MGARPSAAFAVLLLVVGLAAAALWVRSYWSADILTYGGPHGAAGAMAIRGTVWVGASTAPLPTSYWAHQSLRSEETDIPDAYTFACVGWSWGQGWFPLGLPLWLFVLPGAYAAYKLVTRRRFPAGHCSRCGYDLRATPDRCPECGTPPVRNGGELNRA